MKVHVHFSCKLIMCSWWTSLPVWSLTSIKVLYQVYILQYYKYKSDHALCGMQEIIDI